VSSKFHDHPIPGESAEYRAARDELFQAELDLIEQGSLLQWVVRW